MKKVAIIIIVIILAWGLFKFAAKKHSSEIPQTPSPQAQTSSAASQPQPALNGLLVDPSIANSRPIAVMIENYPDARPQSGLSSADIVYEALAEGGITRFMAVYQTQEPYFIGPVRSARTYYADIANELGAVYAHVGGNSDVLANIRAGDYKNISNADQFFDGDYFDRITTRLAPHNVYTSISNLKKLISAHNFSNQASFVGLQFKDDSPVATTSASAITIDFSLPEYLVLWKYHSAQNNYLRYIAGKQDVDASGKKAITSKNIIVQFVQTHPVVSDTPLSIALDLTGGGKAEIFRDGQEINAIWKKSGDDRTRYYSDQNQEILFNRGQTWVELVPADRPVTWK